MGLIRFFTAAFACLTAVVFYHNAMADPDPEVCYERCLKMAEKEKKDKKTCDFCWELKKMKSDIKTI